jgi:hypothetical protein
MKQGLLALNLAKDMNLRLNSEQGECFHRPLDVEDCDFPIKSFDKLENFCAALENSDYYKFKVKIFLKNQLNFRYNVLSL